MMEQTASTIMRAAALSHEAAEASARADYIAAHNATKVALAILRSLLLADDPRVAAALSNHGITTAAVGDLPGARELHQEALAIKRRLFGEDHLETTIELTNLGTVAETLGDYIEARQRAERALGIRRRHGARLDHVAISLNNLGNASLRLGDLATAIASHREALAIRTAIFTPGDPRIAASKDNLGHALERAGDAAAARPLHQHALSLRRAALGPNHPDVGRSLLHLGNAARTDDPAAADAHYRAALDLYEKLGAAEPAAICRANLAVLAADRGAFAEALSAFEQVRDQLTTLYGPAHPKAVEVAAEIAACAIMANDFARAEAELCEAFKRAYSYNHVQLQPLLWFGFSILAARQDRPAEAIMFGKLAANAQHTTRVGLAELETRLLETFIRSEGGIFRHLAQLLARVGRLGEASRVIAMLKEGELFDLVRRDPTMDPRLTFTALTRLEATWQNLASDVLDALGAQAQHADTRFDGWLDAMRVAFAAAPVSDAATGSTDRAIATAVEVAVSPSEGAALLHLIPGSTQLTLILTTRAAQTGRVVAIDERTLNRLVHEFRVAIEYRLPGIEKLGQVLHAHLIAPVVEDLDAERITTLLISPVGALRYLPFAALHDGEGFLIERLALRMVTEAAATSARDAIAAAPLVAGFGTRRAVPGFRALNGVADELTRIIRPLNNTGSSGVYPGRVWLDEAFTAAALAEGLAGYQVTHVASHFVFSSTQRGSHLLLGDGSALDLVALSSPAFRFETLDLLVLSACETALGNGDSAEMEGFAALARRRGAMAVIATLWPVGDAGTPELMEAFYIARRDGATDTVALRVAQRQFIRGAISQTYRHPYHWAAFVLLAGYA